MAWRNVGGNQGFNAIDEMGAQEVEVGKGGEPRIRYSCRVSKDAGG